MAGRASQGVTLMDVGPGESVASISCIDVGQVPAKARQRGGKKGTSPEGDNGTDSTPAKAQPKKTAPKGKRQAAGRQRAQSRVLALFSQWQSKPFAACILTAGRLF